MSAIIAYILLHPTTGEALVNGDNEMVVFERREGALNFDSGEYTYPLRVDVSKESPERLYTDTGRLVDYADFFNDLDTSWGINPKGAYDHSLRAVLTRCCRAS